MKKNTTINISIFNENNMKNAKVLSLGHPKPSFKPNSKPIYSNNK